MLSLWEDLLQEAGDGKKVVALAFIDVRAGFDSVPHVNLLRKLEAIGYDGEARDSTARKMGTQYMGRQ